MSNESNKVIFISQEVVYIDDSLVKSMKRNSIFKCLALIFLTVLLIPVASTNNYAAVKVVSKPITQNELADFTPKTILFDESHSDNGSSLWSPGNASMFSWMLGENGYSSSTNFNQSLDSGILDDYDILVIFFPVIPLTAGEISAVHTFVDNGGGLLLVGVGSSNWWEFRVTNLNPISSTYGITFNTDSVDEAITSFIVHNITYGVTIIETRGDDLQSCSLSVTTPATSVIDTSANPYVAVAQSGLGRVIGVGGPGPFYMYRKNAAGFGDSHFQFSLNVIDWLAENPARTANVPAEAIIIVGPGPSLISVEVENYGMFTGAIHEHTTQSDGANTPQEMVEKGLRLGFDFFVVTDHSRSVPDSGAGIIGALQMRDIVIANNLDLLMIVGAEISGVKHTLGFPLTENVYTGDQQAAVDGIHAQGAIAILNHPTIGFTYAPVYEDRDVYGYDAIDINNRGFFFGGGEDGFFDNFIGAADTHTALEDGVRNNIFVENPSGPNGRVSEEDVVDAILNKRVVIFDPYNNMLYGQQVWVDRYIEIRDQAESAIEASQTLIQSLKDAGEDVGLSEFYLDDAIISLDKMSPGRALRMVQNATSEAVLGIDLSITSPTILEPNTDNEASIVLKNNHTYGLEINSTMYIHSGITFNPKDYKLEIAGESTNTIIRDFTTMNYGLMVYSLNLYEFNTTEFINPILIPMRGIIDNVTAVISQEDEVYEVDFTFWIGRASGKEIGSAVLFYDDGTGEQQAAMDRGWNEFIYTLGPFTPGTELDVHIVVTTYEGQVYTIGEKELTLGTAVTTTTTTSTTTTTTTTTPTGPGIPLDPMLLVALGGIGVVVLLVIVVVMKKRGT